MVKMEAALAERTARTPFELPDITGLTAELKHHVSYSELAVFRDCPLKWQLRYVWKLQPPEKSPRLDLGSAWHMGLEEHYQAILRGAGREETLQAVLAAFNRYNDENNGIITTEQFGVLRWMYDDYSRIYGSDPEYITLGTETEFEFPLAVPSHPELLVVGKIDHETADADDGTLRVWDHKSASGRDLSKDGFKNEMLMEDQFILYAAAKRAAGEPVGSVIYNAARTDKLKRKMLDTERFVRVSQPYSDATLDVVWADYEATAEQLMRMYLDPSLVYSVPNPKQCGWKCEWMRAHLDSRATGRHIVEVAINYGATFKTEDEAAAEPVAEEAPTGGW